MDSWDSRMVLDKYIYNYMKKRNYLSTAEIFTSEADISPNAVAIDSDEGFLTEWWYVFWSVFNTRCTDHEEVPPQKPLVPSSDSNRAMFDMWPAVPPGFRPLPPRVGPSIMMPGPGNGSFPGRSDYPRMIPTPGFRFNTTTSGMHGKGKLTLPNRDFISNQLGRQMLPSSSNSYPSERVYKNPQLCLSKDGKCRSGFLRSTIAGPAHYPPKPTGFVIKSSDASDSEQLRLPVRNSNLSSQLSDVEPLVRLVPPSANFCDAQEKIRKMHMLSKDDNCGARYLPRAAPIKIGSSDAVFAVPQSSVPVPWPSPGPATLISVADVRRGREQEQFRVPAKNSKFNPDRVAQFQSSSPIDFSHAQKNKKRQICVTRDDKCGVVLKSSIAAVEHKIEPPDFSAASMSEQFGIPQQNAHKNKGQLCVTKDEGLVGTTSRRSVVAESTHQTPKAKPKIEPAESGSSSSSN